MNPPATLGSLFLTFLKIGSTAFGGFMALISVVEDYLVERRKLLRHEDMLDGVSLATVLPGPVAVNVVAYAGYRLRGGLGALVCAVAVILPSFLLILALSAAYFAWGQIPAVNKLFMGFIPAVTAIILAAAWNMGKKAISGVKEAVIAVTAANLMFWVGGFYVSLATIAGAAVAGWFLFRVSAPAANPPVAAAAAPDSDRKPTGKGALLSVNALPLVMAAPFWSTDFIVAGKLLLTFATMSVFLFGGGYVFIPLIHESVVQGQGWVTHQEFVDAIAMGQITPGPILISATFIGYKVAGLLGALAATVGIFLPPALLMIAGAHMLERIKRSPVIKAVLRGVRPAVIGMIFTAAVTVGLTAPPNWVSALIFAAALVALLRLRLEVVWVIPAAGITGLLLL